MDERYRNSIDPFEPVWLLAWIFTALSPIVVAITFVTQNGDILFGFAALFLFSASISCVVKFVNLRADPRNGTRPPDPP
jgi:hypothetical protein